MSLTFVQLYTEFRERLGDDGSVDFSNTQLQHALQDAMRVAWPWFYEVVVDETTYTGANFRDINTTDVAVPTTFYNITGIGVIDRIDYRHYLASGTNYYQWQPLRRGVWIDDLQEPAPMIHFSATRARQFELRIRGRRPLTIPVSDSDVVSGTNWPGFTVWLYAAAEKLARASRQEAAAYDPEANGQMRIIATQEAQEMAPTYRMRPVGRTLFSRW